MAVISAISSGATAPPDFTLLSTWESWAQGEFATTPDEYIAECYNDFGGPLNDATAIAGWGVTDATNHPTIRAAAGQGHGGVEDAGFVLTNAARPLYISQAYVVVEGIQVQTTGTNDVPFEVPSAGANSVFDSLILKTPGTESNSYGIDNGADGSIVRNCLIISAARGVDASNNSGTYENCTVIGLGGATTFGFINTGNATLTNVTIIGFLSESVYLTPGSASYCAIDDAALTGTGIIQNITTAAFNNFGSGDYSPAPNGDLDGTGTTLGFSDDISGATRTVPWTIGAYAIPSAGASITFIGPDVTQVNGTQDTPLPDPTPDPSMDSRFTVTE